MPDNTTPRSWRSLVEEADEEYWQKLAKVPVYQFGEREFTEPQRPGEAYKWLST